MEEEINYRQGGLNEAQNLIRSLSGEDWRVSEGHGASKLYSGKQLSIGGNSSEESGFHAYYRTKKAGAGQKAFDHRIRAATLIEEMETVLTAKDAGSYFGRDEISDAVKKDFAAGIMQQQEATITSLAMLDALGMHDEADKAWVQLSGNIQQPVGTNKHGKLVHRAREQEAREVAGREIAGWIREAMDRCEEGRYSSLISSGMAIDKAVSKYDWWTEPPAQQPQGGGGGASSGNNSGKGGVSAGQEDKEGLDKKVKKLTKNQKEEARNAEERVEAEQEELDKPKTIDKLGFLAGANELHEVKGTTYPLDPRFGAQIKGQLAEMVDPKRTRLRDSGTISVADAWELRYGQMDVWDAPQRKTGKLLILADYSGSTRCVCGRDGYRYPAVGAIITGIAHGLAAPFKNSEVWSYSNGRMKLPPGQRGACACDHGSWSRMVFGGGTPDLEMLKWAVKRQGHMDGTSIVIVCDGSPNDANSVRAFADELVKGGVKFCSVLVSRHHRREEDRRARLSGYTGLTQWEIKNWHGTTAYPAAASVQIDPTAWLSGQDRSKGELKKLKSVFEILKGRH